jgi:hypothetical protein
MGVYKVGYAISFVIVFLGCWIYCVAAYGFLLGVGLGWFPSIIAAAIVSIFWPFVLIGAAAIVIFIVSR